MEAEFNPYLAFGWCVLAGFFMSMGAGGGGASAGAVAGSWFSKAFLSDMAVYRPVFGVLVTLVAARTLYEAWFMTARRGSGPGLGPPRTVRFGWIHASVRFGDGRFNFNPLGAAAGGFAISFVGSMLGVGGGFLVTPFMASVLLFPMYLVVGTSLVALMMPLTVSVSTYIALGVTVDWALVAVEVPGVLAGSFLGPQLNRYMNERALRIFVAAVLLALGLYYLIL